MAKHYSVNGNTVIADITKLTDKELAEVQRYKALGFEIISGKVELHQRYGWIIPIGSGTCGCRK